MVELLILGIAALMPIVIHELGHFVAAFLFTQEKLSFRFEWGKLGFVPVPRWIWDFPKKANAEQKKAIAQAGFVFEIAAIAFMPWTYAVVTVVHFTLYPWYAGERNDFTWLG